MGTIIGHVNQGEEAFSIKLAIVLLNFKLNNLAYLSVKYFLGFPYIGPNSTSVRCLVSILDFDQIVSSILNFGYQIMMCLRRVSHTHC